MVVLLIQHPVGDFGAWKDAFDSDPLGRARHGVQRHSVYRAADDPRFIVVELEFGSVSEARAMLEKLRPMWDKAGGGIGFGASQHVQTRILEEVEYVEY